MLIMQILLLKKFHIFLCWVRILVFFLEKHLSSGGGLLTPPPGPHPPPAADVAGDRVNKEAEGEVELWRSRGKISGVL